MLTLLAVDDALLESAIAIGRERGLRGMDAMYAATAALMDAPLVSWDVELIQRASAKSPTQWMGSHANTEGGLG